MVVVEEESIDFIEDSSSSGRCFFNTCAVKGDSVESHCRFIQDTKHTTCYRMGQSVRVAHLSGPAEVFSSLPLYVAIPVPLTRRSGATAGHTFICDLDLRTASGLGRSEVMQPPQVSVFVLLFCTSKASKLSSGHRSRRPRCARLSQRPAATPAAPPSCPPLPSRTEACRPTLSHASWQA